MIELIFVIVILGILASVAIPKLSATRDDAKISTVANNIQTVFQDFGSYYVAQGRFDNTTKNMTNVDATGFGYFTITSGGYQDAMEFNTSTGECVTIQISDDGNISLQKNITTVDSVCKGLHKIVFDKNISVGGKRIVY